MNSSAPTLSPARGRVYILVAALLWSLSGAFTKVLTQPTFLGTHEPLLEPFRFAGKDFPVQIACYRVLFAALALMPLLGRRDFSFRPMMLVMGLCFASMNIFYVSAIALGTAANAILLQYSAPLWIYVVSVFALGEAPDRRGTIALFLGLVGIGVIVAGGWQEGELAVVLIALASGVTYAGVILCLRLLRTNVPSWLTVWNLGLSAIVLMPLVVTLRPPTPAQYGVLVLFGVVQLGLPYWLMARALQVVSSSEAGTLTLLEPLVSPIWAYLAAGEVPSAWTYAGGAIILAALAWRYLPIRSPAR